MKHLFALIGITLLMLSHFGCTGDPNNPTTLDTPEWYSAAPLAADVVLENMYESEVRSLADKTHVQIVTVIEGTSRVTIDALYRGIRDSGYGFPLYECELADEAAEAMGGIAGGMSGSPVGPPGRVMGALAYGVDFSKTPMRFWVTPIEAMEAAKTHVTFGEQLAALREVPGQSDVPGAPAAGTMYAPVKTPLMITGIPPAQLQRLASLMKSAPYQYLHMMATVGGAPQAPNDAPKALAAGDMIGVGTVTGDIINAIGYGTVTQVYEDGTFVAFGHPMVNSGQAAASVYRAICYGLVPSYQTTNKSVAAYGKPIGIITKDLTPAIVGELGRVPNMIPVKLVYQTATGEPIEKNHEVAFGQEALIPMVAASCVQAIRQETTPATIDGTIKLLFKETDTPYSDSFRFTTTDILFDTAFALDGILSGFTTFTANAAGEATLKNVEISIKDTPQFMTATVVDVIPPETVSPGTTAVFDIVLLPHWSSTAAARQLTQQVEIAIPSDFPIGTVEVNVSGAGDTSDGFFFDDFDLFDDETDEAPALPQTLEQLIQQKQAAQTDPGTITITLQPAPFNWDNFDWETDLPPDEDEDAETTVIEKQVVMDRFIVSGTKQITVTVDTPVDEPNAGLPEEPPPAPAD